MENKSALKEKKYVFLSCSLSAGRLTSVVVGKKRPKKPQTKSYDTIGGGGGAGWHYWTNILAEGKREQNSVKRRDSRERH